MLPVWAVATASAAYATGPVKQATATSTAVPTPIRRPALYFKGTPAIALAARTAVTAMIHRKGGFQEGERSSNTQAQLAVARTLRAATARAQIRSRSFQSWWAPIATSAAIAGAKATV
jgi:hypothetical protein